MQVECVPQFIFQLKISVLYFFAGFSSSVVTSRHNILLYVRLRLVLISYNICLC